jgi:hypothetical protein
MHASERSVTAVVWMTEMASRDSIMDQDDCRSGDVSSASHGNEYVANDAVMVHVEAEMSAIAGMGLRLLMIVCQNLLDRKSTITPNHTAER